jgi:hypothetical protein
MHDRTGTTHPFFDHPPQTPTLVKIDGVNVSLEDLIFVFKFQHTDQCREGGQTQEAWDRFDDIVGEFENSLIALEHLRSEGVIP